MTVYVVVWKTFNPKLLGAFLTRSEAESHAGEILSKLSDFINLFPINDISIEECQLNLNSISTLEKLLIDSATPRK